MDISFSADTLPSLDIDELEELKDELAEAMELIEQEIWLRDYPGDAAKLKDFMVSGFKYKAEACEQGYLINPVLPSEFDCTPNENRSQQENQLWWGRPFILTEDWADREQHTRTNHQRLTNEGSEYASKDIEDDINKNRENWYESFPSGVRYLVRCLDGGAWDRSTNWGECSSLEGAIDICKNGPVWRRQG